MAESRKKIDGKKSDKTVIKLTSSKSLLKDKAFTDTGSDYFVVSPECRFDYPVLKEDEKTKDYLLQKDGLNILPPLRFTFQKENSKDLFFPDYLSSVSPVISKNFLDILSRFDAAKTDLIPCVISEENGETKNHNYFAMHIYNYISCIDETYSEIDRYETGVIKNILRLKLSVSALMKIPFRERLVFRLKEAPLIKIFHKSVVDELRNANVSGIKFYKVREWKDDILFETAFKKFFEK